MPWPGGRTILAWARQVADLQPRRLWVSHLRIHRVEALAALGQRRPLEALSPALLAYLGLKESSDPAALARQLGLDRQVLGRCLAELAEAGLAAERNGGWAMTPAGRAALEQGAVTRTVPQRCTFTFLDRSEAGLPPHYLHLAAAAGAAGAGGAFDVSVLEECVRRPAEWKDRHRFPADVSAILLPAPEAPDWRRVVLDRVEVLSVLLAELGPQGEGTRWVGFAVQVPGWSLRREAPILELGEGFAEVFPDLVQEPAAPAWAQAWQTWCQPRGLPRAEVEECRVECRGHLLRVEAPPRLVERLRAANSDAVKGEAWLLAGTDFSRAAARIDLHEGPPR
jgi:hypothetical protein